MARVTTGRDALRDIVVEAVNAKDPDLLSLADDIEVPATNMDTLLEIMERWPRVMMSRGQIGNEPIAALWVPDSDGLYAQAGHLEFYIEAGTARVELLAGTHPDLVSEAPPGLEVADWEDARAVGEGWVV